MDVKHCVKCGHAMVPQRQWAAAQAEGLDVRKHEGRGLCRRCYSLARKHNRRQQWPQIRNGDPGIRPYTTTGVLW